MLDEFLISSPWRKRFNAYVQERFPPTQIILFLVLYITIISYTSILLNPLTPIKMGWNSLPGFIALTFFFFHLRVFDEYKDFQNDMINYPDRILQLGLITLGQLRFIAGTGILIQIGISYMYSTIVLFFWALAFCYSILMAKEFFIGEWLSEKLFLYAILHLLVIHFIVAWIASIVQFEEILQGKIFLLSFSVFSSGLALEVSRKIKLPGEEVGTLLTYSKIFGQRKAVLIVIISMLVAAVLSGIVLLTINAGIVYYLVLVALSIMCCTTHVRFVFNDTSNYDPRLEQFTAFFILGSYMVILSAIWFHIGIKWN